jgi:hypothetical protein
MHAHAQSQGIRYVHRASWEVLSPFLESPVRCESAVEAKRQARSIERQFPHTGTFDYSEINAAIAKERALALLSFPYGTGDYKRRLGLLD